MALGKGSNGSSRISFFPSSPVAVESRVRTLVPIFLALILPVAIVQIVIGFTAFSFTPSYRVGTSAWAGLLLIWMWLYDITTLVVRVFFDHEVHKRCKKALSLASLILRVISLASCMTTSALDIYSGYLLHTTNFTLCSYTTSSGDHYCFDEDLNSTCDFLYLPEGTCYCCYLYESRTTGCKNKFIFDRQTYFTGVRDCGELESVLKPLLFYVGSTGLLGVIVLVFSLHHFSPLKYSITEQIGGIVRQLSLDEGEIVNSIRNVTLERIRSLCRR